MQKLKKRSALLLIAVFVLFLAAAVALTVRNRGKTYSFYENRNLAPLPAASEQSVLDGSYFSALEKYLIDRAAGHTALARLDTRIDLALRRPVIHDVVVREDILLPWLPYETVDPAAITAAAERMAQRLAPVSELVESYGGMYCYAAVPCQYAYHEDRYPSYLNNRSAYTALSREALRAALAEAGVDYLDVGEVFDALGHPDAFSSGVDNHYSIYGALETGRAILSRFNARGASLRVPEEADFTAETVPSPYLGSRTRKLLGTRTSDEPLVRLDLAEPIPFTRRDNGHDSYSYVYAAGAETDGYVTYNFYMGGDIANTVIDTDRPELPSILVYGDSFTNAVECLIWPSFDRMYSLDFRHYQDMTLGEYIETYRPDYVVCIRDYEALLSPECNGTGLDG